MLQAVAGRATGYADGMDSTPRVSLIQGGGGGTPGAPGGPSNQQGSSSSVPDAGAHLTALRDSVASEDRAEDLVLTKTRNVATVTGAFVALSQPVVFSTDVLTGPSTLASRLVVACAVAALVSLGYAIWMVFQQQRPTDDHKGLPRQEIGEDLFNVLHVGNRTPEAQAEIEREAIRELAQHYVGVAKTKSCRTYHLARAYRRIVKLSGAAVVFVAVEFAIALISQG